MRVRGAAAARLPWVVGALVMSTLALDSAVMADRQVPRAPRERLPVAVAVEEKKLAETDGEAAARKSARDDAVNAMFDRRAKAVLARDKAAFLADLDPADTEFVRRQGEVFDSLAKLDFASFDYRLREDTYSVSSIDWRKYGRVADIALPVQTLHYQLEDFDKRPVVRRVVYTVVRRGDRWTIANDRDLEATTSSGTSARRDPWENGPIVVARSKNGLVIGHPDDADKIESIQREVESAVKHVSDRVGTAWGERTVVILPSDHAELQHILESPSVPYEFAAVADAEYTTLNEEATAGSFAGSRVVINPANFNAASSFNRLLIRHELTHVAMFERTGPLTPRWLVEGIAEWVSHAGSDLPTTTLAGPLPYLVDEEGVPDYLPLDSDFGIIGEAGVGYASGWLLCRYIADRWGDKALLKFYDAMGTPTGLDKPGEKLDTVLRSVLKTDEAALLRAWRPYVKASVGSPELLFSEAPGYDNDYSTTTNVSEIAEDHGLKTKELQDLGVERAAEAQWWKGKSDDPERFVYAQVAISRHSRNGDRLARMMARSYERFDDGEDIPGGRLYIVTKPAEKRRYAMAIAIVRSGLLVYEIRVLYPERTDPRPEARRLAAAQLKAAGSA